VQKIRKILNFLLPLAAVLLLYHAVDVNALIKLFSQLSFKTIAWLMCISFMLVLVSSIKWKIFISFLGGKTSLHELYRLYLVGYFINLILPSYLGGDAVRSFKIGKSVGQHRAAAATILERYTGFTAMLFLGLVASIFTSLATWQMEAILIILFLGVCIFTTLSLSYTLRSYFTFIPYFSKIEVHLNKISEAFHLVKGNGRVLLQTYLLSFLYHSLTVLNTWACASAVGWSSPSIGSLFVVLPIILTIGAVPISPQGLGIQEGAFYFFLTRLGATPEQALGIALILRAKGYVLALIGGLLYRFPVSTSYQQNVSSDKEKQALEE
jgi:uncharacterized protein (TIRG00374 family)